MRVVVDAMGGDYAPKNPVQGALEAAAGGIPITIVGREDSVREHLPDSSRWPPGLQLHHAPDVVNMDDPPTSPLKEKKNSSIRIAANLIREGEARALVTAGNTGAAMVCGKLVIGVQRGVDRPPLVSILPSLHGHVVLADVGANIECRSRNILQFAIMGKFYTQAILGIENPRVGLLSIGEEETKGTEMVREANQLLKESNVNFIGNVEGRDVFLGGVDLVVTDGFTGNILLKAAEGLGEMVGTLIKKEIKVSLPASVGYLLSKGALRRFQKRVDYSEYGGAPMLGLNGLAIICHGRSTAKAMRNAVRVAHNFLKKGIHEKIAENMKEFSLLEKLHIPKGWTHDT